MLSSYTHIGKNHIHFETIESTNDYATDLVSKSNPLDGTVISASFQTNGHGQFDRKWDSNDGENILMTIILYPDFIKVENQFLISITISLAICDYLYEKNIRSYIKWPNDIYVGSKKISGILIKNSIMGQRLNSSIVGIGFNLNQTNFEHHKNATSLKLLVSKEFEISNEMNKLWLHIGHRYNELKKIKTDIIGQYENLLYFINKSIKYNRLDESISLTIKGIDDYGRLRAVNESGDEVLITHGEGKLEYI